MPRRVGRNEACPCLSGKRYKKCCWTLHEAARSFSGWTGEDIDALSNGILERVRDGRFAEAEADCEALRQRHPYAVDFLDRLANQREAQGRTLEAAQRYRQAALFSEVMPGYEIGAHYRERAHALDPR